MGGGYDSWWDEVHRLRVESERLVRDVREYLWRREVDAKLLVTKLKRAIMDGVKQEERGNKPHLMMRLCESLASLVRLFPDMDVDLNDVRGICMEYDAEDWREIQRNT